MNKPIEELVGETDLRGLLESLESKKIILKEKEETDKINKIKALNYNKDKFVYVPSLNLYFTKEMCFKGYTWQDTHRALNSKNLKMPNIFEFFRFVDYIKTEPEIQNLSSTEKEKIIHGVFSYKDKKDYIGIFLDARFKICDEEKHIFFKHKVTDENKIICQQHEILKPCINERKYVDLLNGVNSQGLPTLIKGHEIIYGENSEYFPPEDFDKGSITIYRNFGITSTDIKKHFVLDCCLGDNVYSNYFGVYACTETLENVLLFT